MPLNNYRLRPKVEQDLEEIYLYSVQRFGLVRANQYIFDLEDAFEDLAQEPDLELDYREIKPGILGYLVVSHVVFYRIESSEILVIRVLHNVFYAYTDYPLIASATGRKSRKSLQVYSIFP